MPTPLVALAILLCLALPVHAGIITGKVVRVADGDTITVLDSSNTQNKIRLMGIDAPEKAQAFGQQSKQSLSEMVAGKSVSVDWNKPASRFEYIQIVRPGLHHLPTLLNEFGAVVGNT